MQSANYTDWSARKSQTSPHSKDQGSPQKMHSTYQDELTDNDIILEENIDARDTKEFNTKHLVNIATTHEGIKTT
jgi:hypothetical protein